MKPDLGRGGSEEPLAPPPDSKSPPSLVSVVIPALNAADVIGGQLEALSRQTYTGPWEVVVVDNGSTDGTAEVAAGWADRLPGLRVVDASARRGHTVARNAGAAAATGDFLLYCDADDVAYPGWVAAMAEAAASGDVLGGYLETETLNNDNNRSWRMRQRLDRLPTKMGFLPLAITANFGIRKSVLLWIGGFNEDYAEGCNDVEVSWRAQVAGYELCFVPEAVMAYRLRTSLRGLAKQMYRRGLAEPQLYRDFRPHGVPKRSALRMAGGWAKLIVDLPLVLQGPGPRGQWVTRVATLAGRARGSIQHRSLYL
ncbi:MAG: glycosyltransferase [Actinomycetota bacterium]|nr:glycosyltransferase [Actinomycetota bacterium]